MNFEKNDDQKALVEDDTEESVLEKTDKKNDLTNVSFNFINSIIGSGIIGIPYAIRKSGLGLGIILIILVAIISDHSLVLLVKGGQLSGTTNYQDLVLASFGYGGFYILSFIQFIYPFIALISYNVIIGDTVTKVFKRMLKLDASGGDGGEMNVVLTNRFFIIFLASLFITLPLSLCKNIGKLAKISFASLCCVLFLLIVIISRAITLSPTIPDTPNAWAFANDGVIEALGIMVFAFMCHHNSFLLYDSLNNPTQTRWNKVTHISLLISALVTLVFGIIGYAIFTGYTEGDVLENFCKDDDLINVTRFVYTITIMMTYPIECFVCREVIERIFYYNHEFSTRRHVTITAGIVLIVMLISYATDCLGIVLEINGIVTATPLAFIMPAACYLKLAKRVKWLNRNNEGPSSNSSAVHTLLTDKSSASSLTLRGDLSRDDDLNDHRSRIVKLIRKIFSDEIAALITLIFGMIIFVVGSVTIVIHLSKGITCSHGHELFYCKATATAVASLNNVSHIIIASG